jgi:hypothetical protein
MHSTFALPLKTDPHSCCAQQQNQQAVPSFSRSFSSFRFGERENKSRLTTRGSPENKEIRSNATTTQQSDSHQVMEREERTNY